MTATTQVAVMADYVLLRLFWPMISPFEHQSSSKDLAHASWGYIWGYINKQTH